MRCMANLLDVIVNIDIKKAVGLNVDFGKPLIIAELASEIAYQEFQSLEDVKEIYTGTTEAEQKVVAMAEMIFSQQHKPDTIAIACCAPSEEGAETPALVDLLKSIYDKDWYYLLCVNNEQDTIIALADVIEANKRKMYVTRTSSSTILSAIKAKDYQRTVVFFHEPVGEYADAGLVGECGAQTVGAITWKFKTINGLTPAEYTQAKIDGIHAEGGICYVTKAGDNITSEGIVANGEFIDTINAMDWVQFNIEYRVQKLFNSNPKIPYTNNGIAMIENEVLSVLQEAYNNGMIAEDDDNLPEYSTDFPNRSETTVLDRQKREYNLGSFEFVLAGAIHMAVIRGFISY